VICPPYCGLPSLSHQLAGWAFDVVVLTDEVTGWVCVLVVEDVVFVLQAVSIVATTRIITKII